MVRGQPRDALQLLGLLTLALLQLMLLLRAVLLPGLLRARDLLFLFPEPLLALVQPDGLPVNRFFLLLDPAFDPLDLFPALGQLSVEFAAQPNRLVLGSQGLVPSRGLRLFQNAIRFRLRHSDPGLGTLDQPVGGREKGDSRSENGPDKEDEYYAHRRRSIERRPVIGVISVVNVRESAQPTSGQGQRPWPSSPSDYARALTRK